MIVENPPNLARTIACAVTSVAMADRVAVVIKSLCYHVSAAECWTNEFFLNSYFSITLKKKD